MACQSLLKKKPLVNPLSLCQKAKSDFAYLSTFTNKPLADKPFAEQPN
ncbi:hypothetical protein MED121_06995 [Marinomonas sp. MED121]|jgi:hypothetical protein|nr:hypothetical protein MED121_06995 [Marinomonas sp. MED121]